MTVPALFKYMRAEHAALLRTMGILRLGTLHDFRKSEHRRGITDPTEGTKKVTHHIANERFMLGDGSAGDRAFRHFGLIEGVNNRVTARDVGITTALNHDDCFIFCLSEHRSQKVLDSLEGVEACLELDCASDFFGGLTDILKSMIDVQFGGVHKVVYASRTKIWNQTDMGTSPMLIKEQKFADQSELRAIWTPRNRQAVFAPFVLGAPHLGRFWRKVPLK